MTPSGPIVLSVVLPARDEAPNIGPLLRDIAAALSEVPHEILLVDDGSTDGTADAALRTGILAARGRVITTLDADGQNPAVELPRLAAPLLAPDADPRLGLVQGQRRQRRDVWSKRLCSRVANAIRQALLQDGVRDSGCGLKAFPHEAYLALPFFDHVHRFMPALIRREGYEVLLLDVDHANRLAGRSKYSNLGRALVGIVDLAGVAWLLRRRRLAQTRELS